MFSKHSLFTLFYVLPLQAQAEKRIKFDTFSFSKPLKELGSGEHIIVPWCVP